jgi:Fe-S cluster assembly scaffold protein SufB
MNKIKIVNDIIIDSSIDDSIEVTVLEKNDFFSVNSIKLKIIKDTNLEIEYNSDDDVKIDIFINVFENVNFNLFEHRSGHKTKVQYKYYLEENSYSKINKFYTSDSVQELDIINLNGVGAQIDYNFKTISTGCEKYDLMIYHNYRNTVSNINNNGVNIKDGSLVFNITSIVLNDKKGCLLNQNNRIVNLNNNKCEVNPNLLVEENDVEANHSALIGRFSDEEMFYLQSRGISETLALNLLIKGFLIDGLTIDDDQKSRVNQIIDNYWR